MLGDEGFKKSLQLVEKNYIQPLFIKAKSFKRNSFVLHPFKITGHTHPSFNLDDHCFCIVGAIEEKAQKEDGILCRLDHACILFQSIHCQ